MAKPKRTREPSKQPEPAAKPPASAAGGAPAGPVRDPRPYIYGVLSLILAALQVYVMTSVTPNRHAWAQALLLAIPATTALMGLATVVGYTLRRDPRVARAAWIAAVAGGATTLVVTVVVLALLLASAAFLSGVYGAFGKGAAFGVLAAAALIVELVAVIPTLQLKYLLTRGGRRAFGLAPLWGGRA